MQDASSPSLKREIENRLASYVGYIIMQMRIENTQDVALAVHVVEVIRFV